VRTETVVDATTATRLARASARYRLTRPAFWIPVLVELALVVVFAAAGRTGWAVLLAVVAVLGPVLLLAQTPSLAKAMRRRGYRPGTTLTVEWGEETFTVATPDSAGTHHYVSVSAAREVASAIVFRIRGARVLLLLPADVVPPEIRPRLGLRR
jgi:hypothetical protein